MKNDWPADHQNVWKNPDQWGVVVEKPKQKPPEILVATFLWGTIAALAAILFYIVIIM